MRAEQTVSELVAEVLARQAEKLAAESGLPFRKAYKDVLGTRAGRQLSALADGPHRHERAHHWQADLRFERASQLPRRPA